MCGVRQIDYISVRINARLLESRRLRQLAQKMKPGKFASFQPKYGAVRAIFQESLLKLGCRVLSRLHFFCKQNFSISPLGKDI